MKWSIYPKTGNKAVDRIIRREYRKAFRNKPRVYQQPSCKPTKAQKIQKSKEKYQEQIKKRQHTLKVRKERNYKIVKFLDDHKVIYYVCHLLNILDAYTTVLLVNPIKKFFLGNKR